MLPVQHLDMPDKSHLTVETALLLRGAAIYLRGLQGQGFMMIDVMFCASLTVCHSQRRLWQDFTVRTS